MIDAATSKFFDQWRQDLFGIAKGESRNVVRFGGESGFRRGDADDGDLQSPFFAG